MKHCLDENINLAFGEIRAKIVVFNASHEIHYPEQMFDIMDITDSHKTLQAHETSRRPLFPA
jgi:hypothetical protein